MITKNTETAKVEPQKKVHVQVLVDGPTNSWLLDQAYKKGMEMGKQATRQSVIRDLIETAKAA